MEGFQDIEHFVKSLYAAIKKKIPTKVSQLTNDAGYKTTDTNTTYKLSKSGSTVTLTGSDGSTTSVTDSNTTYSSLKNPYSLTVQNNGATVASYDGSTAKTVNLTNATASSNGLMSAADKKAIDREFFRMLPKGGTYIPANADLNSIEYLKIGNYYNSADVNASTVKNIPFKQAFIMYVLSPLSEAYDNESSAPWVYRLRIFVTYTGNIYTQLVNSGDTKGVFNYNAWIKLATNKSDVGLGSVANLDQSKAIKSITRNGTTFTATALDGTTTTFTQQDTNTTYPVATSSTDGLMSKTDKAKLDGVTAGADVSPIKAVKVNGTALTPDSNKAVNVTVPTFSDITSAVDAMSNTLEGRINSLSADLANIKFGVDSDGNYGYIKPGADTVTPFKNLTWGTPFKTHLNIPPAHFHKVTISFPIPPKIILVPIPGQPNTHYPSWFAAVDLTNQQTTYPLQASTGYIGGGIGYSCDSDVYWAY